MKRLIAATLALAACAHPPQTRATSASGPSKASPSTPDAPFRASPPAPEIAAPFVPNRVRSFALANGIRVHTYAQPSELAAMTVSLPLPSSMSAVRRRAVLPIVASALAHRSRSLSATEVADAKLRSGARIRPYLGDDDLQIQVICRSDSLDVLLPIVADLVIRPSFEESEIDFRRLNSVHWLEAGASRPNEIVTHVHDELLFGPQHPYGVWLAKTAAEVNAVRRQDVVAAYDSLREPKRVTITVAGGYDEVTLRSRLEELFEPLRAEGPASRAVAWTPSPQTPRFVLVDRPGATTVRFRSGAVLPHLEEADDFAGLVLQQITGSYASGRLHDRLVVELGITDNAASSYRNVTEASEFAITAEAPADRAADLVREVEATFASLARDGVSEEAVASAKDALTWEHASSFERVQDITWSMTAFALRGQDPNERLKSFEAQIRAVTAADVKRLAARFFAPDRIKTVVMGDVGRIREPLAKAGYRADQSRNAAGAP